MTFTADASALTDRLEIVCSEYILGTFFQALLPDFFFF